MTISVYNTINSKLAINLSDGTKLYDVIANIEPKSLILSFKDVSRISTAFLNESIGRYAIHNPLTIHEVNFIFPPDNSIFNLKVNDVIENALMGDEYNKIIDNALLSL